MNKNNSIFKKYKILYRFFRFIIHKFNFLLTHLCILRYRWLKRIRFKYTRLIVLFGFRLWLKKIHNFEALPQHGPVIIISNHTSYFDWAVLSAIYSKKYIVFLGNKDLLKRPIVSWLMRLNTLIYIDKNKPGFSYFREVVKNIKLGKIVVIYPEGTRSRSGKMIEPKIGFVKLALITETPLIPIGMVGTFNILPPHRNIPAFKKCEIVVGNPLKINKENPLFSDILDKYTNLHQVSSRDMKLIAFRIMNEISKMTGQEWQENIKFNSPTLEYERQASTTISNLVYADRTKIETSKRIVFFDVDGVLVNCQTQGLLAKFLFQKKKINIITFIDILLWFFFYKVNLVKDVNKIMERSFRNFRDWDIDQTKILISEFFDREIRPKIFSQSREIILNHIQKGDEVVLLSSSIFEIVDNLKGLLGLNHIIATQLEKLNNKYTGKICDFIPYGDRKILAIKKFISEEKKGLDTYAYVDHISDLAILNFVTNPIVVNPDRKLKKIAKRQNWKIYDFR